MHPLQYAHTIDPLAVPGFASSKAKDAEISDASALDKPYPLEFRQTSKLCHTVVGQSAAARQVDIADTAACFGQSFYTVVCDTGTMAKVDVVEILAQLGNGEDGSVGDHAALC